jgi:capsular polysaccharide transport system permease protein
MVYGILSRPLFLISAVFFTFESLPGPAREVLWWNPLIHLVGLMRAGFYPIYDASHVSVLYVLALALALIVAGLLLMLASANRLAEQ